MSSAAWHTLLIDLPIALVLFGPLLFVAAIAGKDSNRSLTVPAVILGMLGASSLLAFYFNAYVGTQLFEGGDATKEVSWHLYELGHITARLPIAIALLFACALLLCWLLVHRLGKAARRVAMVTFSVVYILGCGWLLILAHQGARLVDHLDGHARP